MTSTDQGIAPARLDWDTEGQPLSASFNDFYFSSVDGLAETRHVFFQHNDLARRFAALAEQPADRRHFIIGETGFGSGLNFLATWQLWQQTAPAHAQLHFVSVEKYPFTSEDLARTSRLWPELAEPNQALVDQYPPLVGPGFHRLSFPAQGITLTLIFSDAEQGLEQLLPSAHPAFRECGFKVDAWFLDGFAPAKNPDSWTEGLFECVKHLSRPGTTLATFTSSGVVRRGLRAEGFVTENVPGYGLKREMLKAHYAPETTDSEPSGAPHRWQGRPPPSWPMVANPTEPGARRALVIGGGLAGCHSARALAERGWQVTLLERHPDTAQEASGNPQGLLYAKLSPQHSPLAAFNLLSLSYAQQHYRRFWAKGPEFGEACGLIQLAQNGSERALQNSIAQRHSADGLLRPLDASTASELAGVTLSHPGLYFPHCGWLNPPAVCRELLTHPNISVGTGTEVAKLNRAEDQWQALDAEGALMGQAPVVVLANARAALDFEPTRTLPLKAIRGQITQLPATSDSRQLRLALCGEGYVAPAFQGSHCVGASFNLRDPDTQLTERDHRSNLGHLDGFGPAVSALFEPGKRETGTLPGRVAFRCATPDYLPLVGPVPDHAAFLEDFAALRKDAKLDIARPGRYWPGLFVNVGHGSRGLAYTPLSAELLASHITSEPPPVGRDLIEALLPGRFLVRDLMRKRV